MQPGDVRPWLGKAALAAIVGMAVVFHLRGIVRDLPYAPEADEPLVVQPAVAMASTGRLHPGWLGYPGSTVLYPLAAAVHVNEAVRNGGSLLHPNAAAAVRFARDPTEAYLLGRAITVAYSVMTIPLVYLCGRAAVGRGAGLVAAWLSSLSTLEVEHAQTVRTDSAALFFGALLLWLCARLYDRPGLAAHAAAGVAYGLATASRYLMAALVAVPLTVVLALARRVGVRAIRPGAAVGVACAILAFVGSTPYFLFDLPAVVRDLRIQAQPTHLGADGLGFLANLAWYLRQGIPALMTMPPAVLAGVGAVLALRSHALKAILPIVAVAAFLVAISTSSLHWARWIIPLLPPLCVLAAVPFDAGARWLERRGTRRAGRVVVVAAALALVSLPALRALVAFSAQLQEPSTRVLAHRWIVEHLPDRKSVV